MLAVASFALIADSGQTPQSAWQQCRASNCWLDGETTILGRAPRSGASWILEIRQLGDDVIEVTAGASDWVVRGRDGSEQALPSATTLLAPLPTRLVSDRFAVVVDSESRWVDDRPLIESLDPQADFQSASPLLANASRPPSAETLAKWFDALAVLQRMSASSAAFQQTAAGLVVSPGGLDGGAVVARRGVCWRVEASCLRRHELATVLRTDLLEQMDAMQSTVILSPSAGDRGNDVAVVCAPIVVAGETAGAMVGFRRPHGANGRRRIRPLEAQWLELVASAVGGGFCRRDAEEEAARHRILLHQAFPPAVAQMLTRNGATLEEALSPCRREVTLLFTDMRGSSVLARQCAPAEFNRLMTDVLALITDCIHREGGVVIDYAGDGVAAMWNAPANQTDHAERAVRAALNIQAGLPQLSQTWRGQIHRDIKLSIGIHTGKATLGNTGSADRIKYGPRGEAVSLASRVESASKAFSTPVVITEATRRRLQQDTKCRRLGKTLLPSFEQPVELYEPQPSGANDSSAQHVTDVYERALASVERGELHDALEMLLELDRTDADYALVETALQHCRDLIAHGAERPATLAPDATWRESCYDVSHLLAAQHAERH